MRFVEKGELTDGPDGKLTRYGTHTSTNAQGRNDVPVGGRAPARSGRGRAKGGDRERGGFRRRIRFGQAGFPGGIAFFGGRVSVAPHPARRLHPVARRAAVRPLAAGVRPANVEA